MKLKSINIHNLRSIVYLKDLQVEHDLSILIGHNDSGKSTVLQAIDKFLNDGDFIFSDEDRLKTDLSSKSSLYHYEEYNFDILEDEISILCEFNLEETDFKEERSLLLQNAIDGKVTVIAKWSNEKRFEIGRAKKDRIYYVLSKQYENQDFNEIPDDQKNLMALMMKYPESQKFFKNINNTGKPENIERKKALLKYAEENNFPQKFVFLVFKEDLTKDGIWPEGKLISTETSSIDKVIDSAFKTIEQHALLRYEDKRKAIESDIENDYETITREISTYTQTHYIPDLKSFLVKPHVGFSFSRDILLQRMGQKSPSHFDLQGDGTKRRIMVATLQSISKINFSLDTKETAKISKKQIWLFDEPELHLHPGAQRSLLKSLQLFSNSIQIIISTHSTTFIDNIKPENIILFDLNDKQETFVTSFQNELANLLRSNLGLRNSDVLVSNYFIIVEGDTEEIFIPLIYEWLYSKTLNEHSIKIIKSKSASHTIETIKPIEEVNTNYICILDNDQSEDQSYKQLETDGKIKFIGKADFEDSFSNQVWISLLNKVCPIGEPSIWTDTTLDTLREEISLTDANKKFVKLIRNRFNREYMLKNNNETNFPFNFEKTDLAKLLFETVVEINDKTLVPQTLTNIFMQIEEDFNQ